MVISIDEVRLLQVYYTMRGFMLQTGLCIFSGGCEKETAPSGCRLVVLRIFGEYPFCE